MGDSIGAGIVYHLSKNELDQMGGKQNHHHPDGGFESVPMTDIDESNGEHKNSKWDKEVRILVNPHAILQWESLKRSPRFSLEIQVLNSRYSSRCYISHRLFTTRKRNISMARETICSIKMTTNNNKTNKDALSTSKKIELNWLYLIAW